MSINPLHSNSHGSSPSSERAQFSCGRILRNAVSVAYHSTVLAGTWIENCVISMRSSLPKKEIYEAEGVFFEEEINPYDDPSSITRVSFSKINPKVFIYENLIIGRTCNRDNIHELSAYDKNSKQLLWNINLNELFKDEIITDTRLSELLLASCESALVLMHSSTIIMIYPMQFGHLVQDMDTKVIKLPYEPHPANEFYITSSGLCYCKIALGGRKSKFECFDLFNDQWNFEEKQIRSKEMHPLGRLVYFSLWSWAPKKTIYDHKGNKHVLTNCLSIKEKNNILYSIESESEDFYLVLRKLGEDEDLSCFIRKKIDHSHELIFEACDLYGRKVQNVFTEKIEILGVSEDGICMCKFTFPQNANYLVFLDVETGEATREKIRLSPSMEIKYIDEKSGTVWIQHILKNKLVKHSKAGSELVGEVKDLSSIVHVDEEERAYIISR